MATRRKKSKPSAMARRNLTPVAAPGVSKPVEGPRAGIVEATSDATQTAAMDADATAGRSFPVEAFPQLVRDFIQSQAAALGCDDSAVALPVLATIAAATCGAWQLRLKSDWVEPALLWTATVSQDHRITEDASRRAVSPLEGIQRTTLAAADVHNEAHERRRRLTYNSSLPTLARLLQQQPTRGLLVNSRELDGWLMRSRGRSPRAETTRQAWCDLFSSQPVLIESSSTKPPLCIDPAAVSLTGSVLESTLKQLLRNPDPGGGLLSRLLIAAPRVVRRGWCPDSVPSRIREGYHGVIGRLIECAPFEPPVADCVNPRLITSGPYDVHLSDAARQMFIAFAEDVALENGEPRLEPWTSHQVSLTARLALVIHLAGWASGEVLDFVTCSVSSMHAAIVLARWFTEEQRRVLLHLISESTEPSRPAPAVPGSNHPLASPPLRDEFPQPASPPCAITSNLASRQEGHSGATIERCPVDRPIEGAHDEEEFEAEPDPERALPECEDGEAWADPTFSRDVSGSALSLVSALT